MKRSIGQDWNTTGDRALLGYSAGVITGGAIYAAVAIAGFLANPAGTPVVSVLGALLAGALIYAVGLAVVGAPAWWVMHRLGWRRPWQAAVLGFVLNFAVIALYVLAVAGLGAVSMLWLFGLFAAPGPIIGLVIWRVAYRRAVTPPPPPAAP